MPGFVSPPGTCDSHCHVFGPERRFPYAAGHDYYPPETAKEQIFRFHESLGITRGVIVQGAEYDFDNAAVLDAIAAAPDRYRGIAVVDPACTDEEIEQLHHGGIRGLRASFVHGYPRDHAVLRTLAARIRPLGWSIQFHIDSGDLDELTELVGDLPVPVVIDHLARIRAADGVDLPAFQKLLHLSRHENVWFKISGFERLAPPPYGPAIPLARALIEAAPDRVMWGSNYPHPKIDVLPDDGMLFDLIPQLATDEATVWRLLVRNPARLHGWTEE